MIKGKAQYTTKWLVPGHTESDDKMKREQGNLKFSMKRLGISSASSLNILISHSCQEGGREGEQESDSNWNTVLAQEQMGINWLLNSLGCNLEDDF